MPKLSYPNHGRIANARTKEDLDGDKSSSIKLVDQTGDLHPELEQPDVRSQEPVQDEASVAFQKQIEALKKSEKAQRERADQAVKDREEAIKRVRERDTENTQLKKQTTESRLDHITSSLAAAQAEASAAQRDIEQASELSDHKGLAQAYDRLTDAKVAVANLNSGKIELEEQIKLTAEQKQNPEPIDELDKFNLPPLAKDWLRAHPDYLRNNRKNALIQNLHYEVVDEGNEPYSQDYFERLEQLLGMREKPVNMETVEPEDEYTAPEPRKRSSMVSAPVSREAPSSANGDRPGQIRLSLAQKEAAKIAGITEAEYAKQIIELKKQKANGLYGGGQ